MSSPFWTAISTFVALWLIGLFALAIAGTAIFLHILGAVDKTTALPVALSLLSAVMSWTYLVLQTINASHLGSRRYTYPSKRSHIGVACIHLPRIQILVWFATAIVGLVVILRKPLCIASNMMNDAASWQAGLGCWIFRLLGALNAVMILLSLSIFCLLEINGRYMPQGLFHFGHTSSRHPNQRRTLIESPYGTNSLNYNFRDRSPFDILQSCETVNTEDRLGTRGDNAISRNQEKGIKCSNGMISPSPTYHTLDTKNAPPAGQHHIDATLTPSMEAKGEDSITLDGRYDGFPRSTTMDTFPSRPTTATTIAPLDIFPHDQLHERSLSNIPSLPAKLQAHLNELENLRNGKAVPAGIKIQYNRAVLGELTNSHTDRFRSSCALPLRYTSSNLSQPSKHHRCASSVTVLNDLMYPTTVPAQYQHKRTKSQTPASDLDHPAPAWCEEVGMQHPPLTADPAIRKLTDMWEIVRRESSLAHRLSQFEFPFGAYTGKRRAGTLKPERSDIDAANIMKPIPMQHIPQVNALEQEKENINPYIQSQIFNEYRQNTAPASAVATSSGIVKNVNRNASSSSSSSHNRANSNSKSKSRRIGTGLSLMPPLPPPPRIPERAPGHVIPIQQNIVAGTTGGNGSNPQHQRNEASSTIGVGAGVSAIAGSRSGSDSHTSSGSRSVRSQDGGKRKRGKRMVERGRYEVLPR